MKFVTLKMINFMPFYGEHQIVFPSSDQARNVTIIYGDNMRGKTSVLNALRWALYGKALSRNLTERPYHEIVNYNAANQGDYRVLCQLDFTVGSRTYSLTREITPRFEMQKPVTNSDFEEKLFLKRDGELLHRDQIEREINLFAPEQVSRFFLFDGELLSEYELLLEERHDKGELIKDSIEKVLGVPSLINGKMDLELLEREYRVKHNNEIKANRALESIAEEEKKNIERERQLAANESQLKERIKTYETDAQKLSDEIDEINKTIEVQAKLRAKRADIDELEQEQAALGEELRDCLSNSWRDILKSSIAPRKIELERQYDALIAQLKDYGAIENEIQKLEAIVELSRCPTCDQSVSADRREMVSERLTALKMNANESTTQHKTLISVGQDLNLLNKLFEKSYIDVIKLKFEQQDALKRKYVRYRNEAETLQDQLDRLQPQEAAAKKKRMDFCLGEIRDLKRDLQSVESDRQKIRSALADIRERVKRNPEGTTGRASRAYDLASRIQDAFESSIENLRESLKQEVAENATKAFKQMTTQSSYDRLKINKNYGLTIIDSDGNEVKSRSAGAEQIVALSLIDGLSSTGRKKGPIVMDTPFGRLDPNHRARVLSYLSSQASQLILLVHEGEIRRDEVDLNVINHRIDRRYEIREITATSSEIVRL